MGCQTCFCDTSMAICLCLQHVLHSEWCLLMDAYSRARHIAQDTIAAAQPIPPYVQLCMARLCCSLCHAFTAEDEKENVDDKGKKPMREEDLPPAQDAEDEGEADDSPDNRADMELAWENLEVAKFIYEQATQSTYAKELAGKQLPTPLYKISHTADALSRFAGAVVL